MSSLFGLRWWLDPFIDNPFLQRSLAAGILVAWACAITGTFVVLRGMAFLGDALAHGVLPGVAGALLLGAPGILGAAVGAAVMILGVNVVTTRSKLSDDTAIGLLFVGMLGLGVMMVSKSSTFSGDIVSILFGEILGISRSDLVRQFVALIAIAIVARLFIRPFLMLSFDPEQADVAGWSSRRYSFVMLAMVATCVVASFQTVGTLLVFGMLLAPAGVGVLIGRGVPAMMAIAALIGAFAVYLGLLVSYHFDLAASASIVVVAVVIFFAVFIARALHDIGRQRASDVL